MTSNINAISLVVITHNYNDRYCLIRYLHKAVWYANWTFICCKEGPLQSCNYPLQISVSNRFTVISVMKGIVHGRYIAPHPAQKLHSLTSKPLYTVIYWVSLIPWNSVYYVYNLLWQQTLHLAQSVCLKESVSYDFSANSIHIINLSVFVMQTLCLLWGRNSIFNQR